MRNGMVQLGTCSNNEHCVSCGCNQKQLNLAKTCLLSFSGHSFLYLVQVQEEFLRVLITTYMYRDQGKLLSSTQVSVRLCSKRTVWTQSSVA